MASTSGAGASSSGTPPAHDKFHVVKRKLETMKYSEPLDKLSVPLAEHLVDDLVHTTKSYRNLKLQHNHAMQELGETSGKLNALSKEHQRVILENNVLHLEQIKAAEAKDEVETKLYNKLKRQEQDIADFEFWKEKKTRSHSMVMMENEALKRKLEEIRPGYVAATLGKKLRDEADAEATGATTAVATSSEKAAAAELEATKRKMDEMSTQIVHLNAQIENREREIKRLGNVLRENANLDTFVLAQAREESEQTVKTQAGQIAYLTERVTEYEDVHAAYKGVEEEKFDLMRKLDDVMGEKRAMEAQLKAKEEMEGLDLPRDEELELLRAKVLNLEASVRERTAEASRERNEKEGLQYSLDTTRELETKLQAAFQEKSAAFESASVRITQLESDLLSSAKKEKELFGNYQRVVDQKGDAKLMQERVSHLEKVNHELASKLGEAQGEARRHLETCESLNGQLVARNDEIKSSFESKLESDAKAIEYEKRCELLQAQCDAKDADILAAKAKSKSKAADYSRLEIVMKNLQSELDSEKALNAALNDRVAILEDERKSKASILETTSHDYSSLQQSTATKISQLQEEVSRHRKSEMERSDKIYTLERKLADKAIECEEASQNSAHYKSEKDKLEQENSVLATKIKGLRTEKASLEAKVQTGSVDGDGKEAQLRTLGKEIEQLQKQNSDLRNVVHEKSVEYSKSESEKAALQKRLQDTERFMDLQKSSLSHAQQQVFSNLSHEEATKTQIAVEQANTIKYKTLYEKTKAEMNMLKDHLLLAQSQQEEQQEELVRLKTLGDEKSAQTNQLKTLISQLDSTQDKLVHKLRETMSELEEERLAKRTMESNFTFQEESREQVQVEIFKLKSIVKTLDSEKDAIQDELDRKCESNKRLEHVIENQASNLHAAKTELSNVQMRMNGLAQAASTSKGDQEKLLKQCKKLHDDNTRLKEENRRALQEIHALSEDMTQMAREQQVVNSDLVKAVNTRNDLQDECQVARKKAVGLESIVEMKNKEIDEYTKAYQELGGENTRLSGRVSHLEREIMEKNAEITARESEISSLENLVSGLEVENRQAITDLSSYETTASDLTSALSSAEKILTKESREKLGLIEKVNIAKQSTLQLEATRNTLQNEVYQTQMQMQVLSQNMDDLGAENAHLREQLEGRETKVARLEGIINDLRGKEFASSTLGGVGGGGGGSEGGVSGGGRPSKAYNDMKMELAQVREELEKQTVMYETLKSVPQTPEPSSSIGMADMANEIDALQADNERLIELLAKAESECNALREANVDISQENSSLKVALTSTPITAGGSGRDSVQSTPGKSPGSKLQEQMQVLKQENMRLRSNLEATQATVGKLGNEINRVRSEYQDLLS